ncbi:MAG: peptidoglycan DD-metalloendopeptidase family protein [Candidatus Andersenbacteria bacterium]|nr:peptidoglycan DD-metalloendopeptidase family protein [Candidatus Andersenbacteria bacterium]
MPSDNPVEPDDIPLFKKFLTHVAFLSLMATVAWHGHETSATDRNSLLYTIVAGEEIIEGPLDPTAYAGTDAPGVGGARLAAVDAAAGLDLITFDDPEASFANTLGGQAVQAPAIPTTAEAEATPRPAPAKIPFIYTVAEGDTIGSIADQFNIRTNTILWSNGLDSTSPIHVGDHLTILPVDGVLHTVTAGDTVLALAQKYDAAAADIIAHNQLSPAAELHISQKLIIPGGTAAPRTAPAILSRDQQLADADSDTPPPPPAAVAGPGLAWPTTTRHVAQYFRWGHTGIDLDNRARPPVYAAADGTVEYTGRLGGYGNLVIISHGGGMQTYYAHLDKSYVSRGQSVSKGEAVAKMGSTGRSTGPHLHFEVRQHGQAVNPLSLY